MTGLVLRTDGTMGTASGKDGNMLEFLYGAIGCELIDVVRARRLPGPYVMVVDDMGICRGLPVNPWASVLYGTDLHGSPICGDAVILREEEDPETGEPDLKGLRGGDAEHIKDVVLEEAYAEFLKTAGQ